ncbi:hypothetical protein GE09DRAFT_114944 [Coniochaeta sp. 2T2.1]|nr:hypothetical protein GE09DRAFT_114944 [Coniochaeta sp. 2T2.1]
MANASNNSFRLNRLPPELRNMVWESTAGIQGGPIFQCLEADFMDGFRNWFDRHHIPTAVHASLDRGLCATTGASFYEGILDVTRSHPEARGALQHLDKKLRKAAPRDLVEIRARFRQAPPRQGYFSVWLSPSRDILCLQSTGKSSRNTQDGPGAHCVWWFNIREWHWYPPLSYHPLPFFGLDKMERVAVDWQLETAKGGIHRDCHERVCSGLRMAWYALLYQYGGGSREYCLSCITNMLHHINASDGDAIFLEDTLAPIWQNQSPTEFGPDEPGTFVCQGCNNTFPAGEGRIKEEQMVDTGPLQPSRFDPICHDWHRPTISSDLETILMGRLPALKTFYIIDQDVKLKPGAELTLPYEKFEGHLCHFVEVNTDDDAWDLDPAVFPPSPPVPNTPVPFTSFAYADMLQRVAFRHASMEHARKLMREQEAQKDPFDVDMLTDSDSDPDSSALANNDPFAGRPLNRKPLTKPVQYPGKHMRRLKTLEYPNIRRDGQDWPEHIFTVRVKVMARIDN